MRNCIFCPDKASSKEDAWPNWLMKHFPAGGTINAERRGRILNKWTAKKPRITIRCVCKKCNNEWMSKLEISVKPTILSILENTLDLLEQEAQRALAFWAVKNAMVYEYLDPKRTTFYTKSERYNFHYDNMIPNPGVSEFMSQKLD